MYLRHNYNKGGKHGTPRVPMGWGVKPMSVTSRDEETGDTYRDREIIE